MQTVLMSKIGTLRQWGYLSYSILTLFWKQY